jgi:5-formyltetrahydrofolate cyclo-ligase
MKSQLRKQVRTSAIPAGASAAIQRRLVAQDWWAGAFQVGIYRSTPKEPSTDALLADLLARGARVAVPMRRGRNYVWGWVDGKTRWHKKAHGISEPIKASEAKPEDLRVIVVPGLAFDAHGGRLGHGGGHFDRLLADTPALMVGLCFENRLVQAVPMESHDVRMDVVATEKRLFFAPTAAGKLEHLIGGKEE